LLSMGSRAVAVLPLHGGRAPKWLFGRMVKLAACIVEVVVDEYGVRGLLERLSDPWFFQSLSCVLGYDWHSSGTTTVTCGALKEAVNPLGLGVAFCGGKGRASRRTPAQIVEHGEEFGLSSARLEELVYASRMSAKVDNSLVQDGYHLYHHTFVFDEGGDWIVVQQGINEGRGNARRYHWGPDSEEFVEPREEIVCDSRLDEALDMTADVSGESRDACVDLVCEDPRRLRRMMAEPVASGQARLDGWAGRRCLVMPSGINWGAMKEAYDFQPRGYEELVGLRGVGPATVRGLALVAELVYGESASWADPVRYSFAFGGKDGVPFPVDREAMDEAVDVLKCGIKASSVRREERMRALGRLKMCVPAIPQNRINN